LRRAEAVIERQSIRDYLHGSKLDGSKGSDLTAISRFEIDSLE